MSGNEDYFNTPDPVVVPPSWEGPLPWDVPSAPTGPSEPDFGPPEFKIPGPPEYTYKGMGLEIPSNFPVVGGVLGAVTAPNVAQEPDPWRRIWNTFSNMFGGETNIPGLGGIVNPRMYQVPTEEEVKERYKPKEEESYYGIPSSTPVLGGLAQSVGRAFEKPTTEEYMTKDIRDKPFIGPVARGAEALINLLNEPYETVGVPAWGWVGLGLQEATSKVERAMGPPTGKESLWDKRLAEAQTRAGLTLGDEKSWMETLGEVQEIGRALSAATPEAAQIGALLFDPLNYVGGWGAKATKAGLTAKAVEDLSKMNPVQRALFTGIRRAVGPMEIPTAKELGMTPTSLIEKIFKLGFTHTEVSKLADIAETTLHNLLGPIPDMTGPEYKDFLLTAKEAANLNTLAPLVEKYPELKNVLTSFTGRRLVRAIEGMDVTKIEKAADPKLRAKALELIASGGEIPKNVPRGMRSAIETFRNEAAEGRRMANPEAMLDDAIKFDMAMQATNAIADFTRTSLKIKETDNFFIRLRNNLKNLEANIFIGLPPPVTVQNWINNTTMAWGYGVTPWSKPTQAMKMWKAWGYPEFEAIEKGLMQATRRKRGIGGYAGGGVTKEWGPMLKLYRRFEEAQTKKLHFSGVQQSFKEFMSQVMREETPLARQTWEALGRINKRLPDMVKGAISGEYTAKDALAVVRRVFPTIEAHLDDTANALKMTPEALRTMLVETGYWDRLNEAFRAPNAADAVSAVLQEAHDVAVRAREGKVASETLAEAAKRPFKPGAPSKYPLDYSNASDKLLQQEYNKLLKKGQREGLRLSEKEDAKMNALREEMGRRRVRPPEAPTEPPAPPEPVAPTEPTPPKPPSGAVPDEAAAKILVDQEPWQMPLDEYSDNFIRAMGGIDTPEARERALEVARDEHLASVLEAKARGEALADDVLADHPDLRAPEAPVAPKPVAKQGWQMTPNEFYNAVMRGDLRIGTPDGRVFVPRDAIGKDPRYYTDMAHRNIVEKAARGGETIPPEVLDYYPTLKSPPPLAPIIDDSKRIKQSAGQWMPLGVEDAREATRQWVSDVMPDATPQQISEAVAAELRRVGLDTPEGVARMQDEIIQKYVEEPAKRLTRQLIAEGKRPHSSNAYGPGQKGVYWHDPKTGENNFTPLEQHEIPRPPVEVAKPVTPVEPELPKVEPSPAEMFEPMPRGPEILPTPAVKPELLERLKHVDTEEELLYIIDQMGGNVKPLPVGTEIEDVAAEVAKAVQPAPAKPVGEVAEDLYKLSADELKKRGLWRYHLWGAPVNGMADWLSLAIDKLDWKGKKSFFPYKKGDKEIVPYLRRAWDAHVGKDISPPRNQIDYAHFISEHPDKANAWQKYLEGKVAEQGVKMPTLDEAVANSPIKHENNVRMANDMAGKTPTVAPVKVPEPVVAPAAKEPIAEVPQADYEALNRRLWELKDDNSVMARAEKGRIRAEMKAIDDAQRPLLPKEQGIAAEKLAMPVVAKPVTRPHVEWAAEKWAPGRTEEVDSALAKVLAREDLKEIPGDIQYAAHEAAHAYYQEWAKSVLPTAEAGIQSQVRPGNVILYRTARDPREVANILEKGNEGFVASTHHVRETIKKVVETKARKGMIPIYTSNYPSVAGFYQDWKASLPMTFALEVPDTAILYKSTRAKAEGGRGIAYSLTFPDTEIVIDAKQIARIWRIEDDTLSNVMSWAKELDTAQTRRGQFRNVFKDADPALAEAGARAIADLREPPKSLGRPFLESPVDLKGGKLLKGNRVVLATGDVVTVTNYSPIAPEHRWAHPQSVNAFLWVSGYKGPDLPGALNRLNMPDNLVMRVLGKGERISQKELASLKAEGAGILREYLQARIAELDKYIAEAGKKKQAERIQSLTGAKQKVQAVINDLAPTAPEPAAPVAAKPAGKPTLRDRQRAVGVKRLEDTIADWEARLTKEPDNKMLARDLQEKRDDLARLRKEAGLPEAAEVLQPARTLPIETPLDAEAQATAMRAAAERLSKVVAAKPDAPFMDFGDMTASQYEILAKVVDYLAPRVANDLEVGRGIQMGGEAYELLKRLITEEIGPGMTEARIAANRIGKWWVQRAILNYDARLVVDDLFSWAVPFGYWPRATASNLAMAAFNRPAIVMGYLRAREALDEIQEEEGFPKRFKGKMRVPVPFLPQWMDDGVYFDPLKDLVPVDRFITQPAQNLGFLQMVTGDEVANEIRAMAQRGETTPEEAENAIRQKGDLWKKIEAELKASRQGDAFDIGSLFFAPHAPLDWAHKLMTGRPEDINYLFPLSRHIKGGTAILKEAYPNLAQWIPEGGADPEGALREKLGVPKGDATELYHIDRMLVSMAMDGTISEKQARQALIERAGLVYEAAKQRAAVEAGVGPMASMAGAYSGRGIAEGELKRMETKRALDELVAKEAERLGYDPKTMTLGQQWDALKQHGVTGSGSAVNKWYEANPGYSAADELYKQQEQRLAEWLVEAFWDKYNTLPALDRRLFLKENPDARQIVEKPVTGKRQYEKMPVLFLEKMVTLVGGYVPKAKGVIVPPVPAGLTPYQPQTPGESMAYQGYLNMAESLGGFDLIQAKEKEYYALPEGKARRDYVKQDPTLEKWWDFGRDLRKKFPAMAKKLWPEQVAKEEAPKAQAQGMLRKIAEKYGGWDHIQDVWDQYYSFPEKSPERRRVWNEHPELKGYMDEADPIRSFIESLPDAASQIKMPVSEKKKAIVPLNPVWGALGRNVPALEGYWAGQRPLKTEEIAELYGVFRKYQLGEKEFLPWLMRLNKLYQQEYVQ